MARKDRLSALRLRLQGKSYAEIQRELGGIPKSTLSAWLANVVLSDRASERLKKRTREGSARGLIRRNKNQTALAVRRSRAIEDAARREIGGILERASTKELLLLGVALYWAEGYKRPIIRKGRELTQHSVSLTNADPQLLRTFLKFAIDVCGVAPERVRINVRIFQHLNQEDVLEYWADALSLPKD